MNANTKTVLILGAQGRLGAAAVRAFAGAGWRVRAQARRPQPDLPAGALGLECDAFEPDALCRAAEGADVIVNALNAPYADWEKSARALAENALAAAASSGALLMFPGNVYNFGQALPAVLRPDTPQLGDGANARIRIDIERGLAEAARDGVDSVVLRAGDFFGGAARGAWFDRVLTASLRKGKLVYPGPPGLAHAWAYLPDLAAAFVLLAEQRAQLRGAHSFHFAGHTLCGLDWQAEAVRLMARPIRLAALPWGAIRLMAWFSPSMRRTLALRYLWRRPHRLDDSALRARLGAPPHTPLAEALAQSLRGLGLAPDASASDRGLQGYNTADLEKRR